MYALTKSGTYNVRSLGTNDNECLHAIEHSLSHTSGGVPSAHDLRTIKATSFFINTMLMRQDLISFRHARRPKYQFNISKSVIQHDNEPTSDAPWIPPKVISEIVVKDHAFDLQESKGKALKGVSGWLKPARRVRGVRGLMCFDESSCPLSQRM